MGYPNRKRNRLKNYNYKNYGYYFITICVNNRKEYFGNVNSGKVELNKYGKIIEKYLLSLPEKFTVCNIDYYVIMPNHIHFILVLDNSKTEKKFSVSDIVRFFKSITTIELHKEGFENFKWQRSYYDRIIRDEKELYLIRRYIEQNPLRWELERDNPDNLEI
jgi:REP element-mobilizing transposase RayT